MAPGDRPSEGYARYMLGLLVVVYVLNFLDRQILSILAERIKADLGLGDDQIGFLYGTAFAVFYALFGIPLGRLADVWVRTRLIALGLAVWSLMTAASAFARGFGELSAARIGVGVGEASANPAAYSLLSDSFPPARRATVLAIYSSGIYIGAGLGLGLGGLIVQRWDAAFAGAAPPLGLHGWQVAFLAVGLPGLLLATWVATLREPRRGDDHPAGAPARPLRTLLDELSAVLPPLTLLSQARLGGAPAVVANLGLAAAVGLAVLALIAILGTPAQWIALGIGAYAALSWAQALRRRDPQGYAAIFEVPSLRYAAVGFALLAFTGYGVGFWVPPYFIRVRGVSEAEAGLWLGGTAAVAGWLGVTLGGVWSDRWHRRAPGARFYVGIAAALLPLPFVVWMLRSGSNPTAFALNVLVGIGTSMWIGPGATTVQDLVPPRLRGTASAAYLLVITFIGLALGPYTIGRLSVALGDLRAAMLWALLVNPVAALLLWRASRTLNHRGGQRGTEDQALRMRSTRAVVE
ncbi:MAG TPA: MFS transporter [Candidatus Dormibacteraeota bacterium]|nr:MFS transporter [Candidatus Dormibacteraeota bacterium]